MITPEWINTQIGFLNLRLGIYQPSVGRDFYFNPTPGFYGFISQGSTSALNEAMRMLADHIIAPSSPRIEEWDGPDDPLTTWEHDWSEQKETKKRVVACISCGQKLRIPESADAIRVFCRTCGKSFVVTVRIRTGG